MKHKITIAPNVAITGKSLTILNGDGSELTFGQSSKSLRIEGEDVKLHIDGEIIGEVTQ